MRSSGRLLDAGLVLDDNAQPQASRLHEAERLLAQRGLMLQGSRSVVARTQYPSRTL